jgi:hypothetical protein
MAKCLRVVGQGRLVRMSDEDAHEVVVRDNDGEYCPKSEWKKERTDADDRVAELRTGPKGRRVIADAETLQTHRQHKRQRA